MIKREKEKNEGRSGGKKDEVEEDKKEKEEQERSEEKRQAKLSCALIARLDSSLPSHSTLPWTPFPDSVRHIATPRMLISTPWGRARK